MLAGEGWHPGVIGIVASRLVERSGRPVVMVALDGEHGRGSGRSIDGFDLLGGLQRLLRSTCAATAGIAWPPAWRSTRAQLEAFADALAPTPRAC